MVLFADIQNISMLFRSEIISIELYIRLVKSILEKTQLFLFSSFLQNKITIQFLWQNLM